MLDNVPLAATQRIAAEPVLKAIVQPRWQRSADGFRQPSIVVRVRRCALDSSHAADNPAIPVPTMAIFSLWAPRGTGFILQYAATGRYGAAARLDH